MVRHEGCSWLEGEGIEMEPIMLTLLIQTTIEADDEEDYQQKRDRIIDKLEKAGFSVNIEDESVEEDFLDPDDDDEEDGW